MSAAVQTQRKSAVRLGRRMRRGLTMFEGLFVTAIAMVSAAGLMALYSQWVSEQKAQESVKAIRLITEVADGLVGQDPVAALGGATNRSLDAPVIATRLLPPSIVIYNASVASSWIGTPYNPRQTYLNIDLVAANYVHYSMTMAEPHYHIRIWGAFPKEACRRFMTHLMGGAAGVHQTRISSGGASPQRTAPQTPASVDSWCQLGASGGNAGLDINMTIPVAR